MTSPIAAQHRPGPAHGRVGDAELELRLLMHDVRNALAGIEVTAHELSSVPDMRLQRLGLRLERGTARLAECFDRLSRPSAVRPCLFDAVADACVLGEALAAPGTTVAYRFADEIVTNVDGLAVFRILSNLVINAVAALNRAEGGDVLVDVRCLDGMVVAIDVADGAGGLFASNGGRQAFANPRSGLGLTIAAALACQIGGSLQLLESDRTGTTIRLVFLA